MMTRKPLNWTIRLAGLGIWFGASLNAQAQEFLDDTTIDLTARNYCRVPCD